MAAGIPKPRRTKGTVAYRTGNYFALGVIAVGCLCGVIYHFTPPAQKLRHAILKGKFAPTEEEIDKKKLFSIVPKHTAKTMKKIKEEKEERMGSNDEDDFQLKSRIKSKVQPKRKNKLSRKAHQTKNQEEVPKEKDSGGFSPLSCSLRRKPSKSDEDGPPVIIVSSDEEDQSDRNKDLRVRTSDDQVHSDPVCASVPPCSTGTSSEELIHPKQTSTRSCARDDFVQINNSSTCSNSSEPIQPKRFTRSYANSTSVSLDELSAKNSATEETIHPKRSARNCVTSKELNSEKCNESIAKTDILKPEDSPSLCDDEIRLFKVDDIKECKETTPGEEKEGNCKQRNSVTLHDERKLFKMGSIRGSEEKNIEEEYNCKDNKNLECVVDKNEDLFNVSAKNLNRETEGSSELNCLKVDEGNKNNSSKDPDDLIPFCKSRYFEGCGDLTKENRTRSLSLEHLNDLSPEKNSEQNLESHNFVNKTGGLGNGDSETGSLPYTKEPETYPSTSDGGSKFLSCPLCWKNFESSQSHVVHMKACAVRHNLTTRQLLDAVELQEKQAAEREALGLPKISSTHVTKRTTTRRTTGVTAAGNDTNLQLALALSASIQEAEELEQLEKDECLMEAGLGREVVERQKMMLERFGFTSSRPAIHTANNPRLRQGSKNKNKSRATILTQRTKEERERIITEKVAIILIGDETNTHNSPDDNPLPSASIGTSQYLQKYEKKDGLLWNAVKDSPSENDHSKHYVKNLANVITPCAVKAGDKLRHLSQVPGREKTPMKPFISTPEKGFCPSTSVQEDEATKKEMECSIKKSSVEEHGTPKRETVNSAKSPKARRSLLEPQFPIEKAVTKNSFTETLVNDWRALLNRKAMSDVKVIVELDEEIHAHKLVFYARCRAILKDIIRETDSKTNISTNMLVWIDISHRAALAFLQFIYSGLTSKVLRLEEKDISSVRKLCQRYRVTELFEHLQVMNNVRRKVSKSSLNMLSQRSLVGSHSKFSGSSQNNITHRKLDHKMKDMSNPSKIHSEYSSSSTPPLGKQNKEVSPEHSENINKESITSVNSSQNLNSSLQGSQCRDRSASPDMFMEEDITPQKSESGVSRLNNCEEVESGTQRLTDESNFNIRCLLSFIDKCITQNSEQTSSQRESPKRSSVISQILSQMETPRKSTVSNVLSNMETPRKLTHSRSFSQQNLGKSSQPELLKRSSVISPDCSPDKRLPSPEMTASYTDKETFTISCHKSPCSRTQPIRNSSHSSHNVLSPNTRIKDKSESINGSKSNSSKETNESKQQDESGDKSCTELQQSEDISSKHFHCTNSPNKSRDVQITLSQSSCKSLDTSSNFDRTEFLEHLLSDSPKKRSSIGEKDNFMGNESVESKRKLSETDLSNEQGSDTKRICRESLEYEYPKMSPDREEDVMSSKKPEGEILDTLDLTQGSDDSSHDVYSNLPVNSITEKDGEEEHCHSQASIQKDGTLDSVDLTQNSVTSDHSPQNNIAEEEGQCNQSQRSIQEDCAVVRCDLAQSSNALNHSSRSNIIDNKVGELNHSQTSILNDYVEDFSNEAMNTSVQSDIMPEKSDNTKFDREEKTDKIEHVATLSKDISEGDGVGNDWDSFDEICNAPPPDIFSQGLSKLLSSVNTSSNSEKDKKKSDSSSLSQTVSPNSKKHSPKKTFNSAIQSSPDYKALLEDSLVAHLNDSVFWHDENEPELKPSLKDRKTALQMENKKYYRTPSPQQKGVNTDNVTPPANYSSMKTPDLKKELKKYGLKPSLTKKQAKIMLRYIYDQLHPFISVSGSEDSAEETNDLPSPFKIPDKNTRVPRSPTKKGKAGESSKSLAGRKTAKHVSKSPVRRKLTTEIDSGSDCDDLSMSQGSSSSSTADFAEEMLYEDLDDQDIPLSQDGCSSDMLPTVVQRYIMRNPELHQKILEHEPIWIEEFCDELKAQNYKFKVNQLMDYFDEQCITFRTQQGQRSRMRKKQKQEARKQKSPTKKKTKTSNSK